jgi:hypothetical protein
VVDIAPIDPRDWIRCRNRLAAHGTDAIIAKPLGGKYPTNARLRAWQFDRSIAGFRQKIAYMRYQDEGRLNMRNSARLQYAFRLARNMYLNVADHSFAGTSSSLTATEYNFQREKRCHANAGNGNRSELSRTSVLLRLTRHRSAKN